MSQNAFEPHGKVLDRLDIQGAIDAWLESMVEAGEMEE